MTENIKHDKINGEDYRNLIISAAQSLENSKEEIATKVTEICKKFPLYE